MGQLVTVGFQVVIEDSGKRQKVGRIYHVQSAALQLRDLLRQQGKDAECVSVQRFEGDRKDIK